MNTGTVIRKIFIVALWVAVGGGLLSLLLAANSKKKRELCAGYKIEIKGIQNNYFITQQDVVGLIRSATKGNIREEPLADFDLQRLENLLEQKIWVQDAELWFDSRNVLHVSITEREPVARIFTTGNGSFYIDKTLQQLPVSGNVNIRVPVFTGFPGEKKWDKADSVLAGSVKTIAGFIAADAFWNAQVSQVDIVDKQHFEIIPLVGNTVIRIGDDSQLEQKFNRLMIFFKEVLRKTGFDRYSVIDARYHGQVVATKKGTQQVVVDSLRLKKNVKQLLEAAGPGNNNNEQYIKPSPRQNDKQPEALKLPPANIPEDPDPVKTTIRPDSLMKTVPKAIMPERTTNVKNGNANN
ncbi:MAG: hypothetical protein GC171_05345 [Terrimonas sp.]|nr:hypothetical protein [Terrimonas sp.]